MSLQERARKTRSHSLKPLGQPSLLTQRSKRTLSLPAKPIIPPLINIQHYHDNWESYSDEDEPICDTYEECMGMWINHFVSIFVLLIVNVAFDKRR